ncbi:MAG TPA: SGNH/GDSL hydrolase family protein [Candidatus Saccharimonadales bacterium]|nr:SGNH/GDSL hydrolase family protein [Candidatus Saccharimonadales bacterium]
MNTNPAAKTILCYGDSNTWGQKPDKSGRFPADARWTGLLQDALGKDYYVIEEGLSSRTTDLEYGRKPGRNGKTYLEPCLDSHMPLDFVILMLGTNDLKIEFDRSAQDVAEAIKELIALVQSKTAKDGRGPAKVILVSPIHVDDQAPTFAKFYVPDFYNHDSALKSQALGAELQKVAANTSCAFVDAAKVAHAGEDGIHFSQEAHTGLAKALIEEVQALTKEES